LASVHKAAISFHGILRWHGVEVGQHRIVDQEPAAVSTFSHHSQPQDMRELRALGQTSSES
jgi:hypothetical protein